MPDIYPSKNYFREAVDKHLTPIMLKKLEKNSFDTVDKGANAIAEKYQNLSPEELSDLVLEGEEVFQQTNTPLIHVKEEYYQKPYYETLIRYVVPNIRANEVWVSRSSNSAYNVSDSRGLYFRVYDADLQMLQRGNSGVYPSQLLVPIKPEHV